MNKCFKITIDGRLGNDEVNIIVQAIQQLRGVINIEMMPNNEIEQDLLPPAYKNSTIPPPPLEKDTTGGLAFENKVINECLRWGMLNHKLKPEELKTLNGQEIVNKVTEMLEIMPEDMKKIIASMRE